ncbi:hypothetical protein PR202_gb19177 [Eleusine coracana subsp. coracana]|uniref:Uncharacterized protein n=1 Tax=Eleusine coracana subsp. coracana TaxID=191504 RepID=A0AAV5F5B5_ELECO|nr:hypothetical protein PR202_gb19177 [Eleusine coracana subsp. coracana]
MNNERFALLELKADADEKTMLDEGPHIPPSPLGSPVPFVGVSSTRLPLGGHGQYHEPAAVDRHRGTTRATSSAASSHPRPASCGTAGYRPSVVSTSLPHLAATGCGHLLLPFVPIRERLRDAVELFFSCEFDLFIEFTGLISWCKGASIGWHSDDNKPYLRQRAFTAVCYLNDHGKDYKGGILQFQDGYPSSIVPVAGVVQFYYWKAPDLALRREQTAVDAETVCHPIIHPSRGTELRLPCDHVLAETIFGTYNNAGFAFDWNDFTVAAAMWKNYSEELKRKLSTRLPYWLSSETIFVVDSSELQICVYGTKQ